ncbi:MAG: hypothetical protein QOH62_2136 [Solirubrobacteraceae bacterium]|nr:hypothetical protein [Solirubrobacteraceae bacterium]
MIRSSVDLPEPDGPSSAVSDPAGISSDTPCNASNVPKRLLMLWTAITRLPFAD